MSGRAYFVIAKGTLAQHCRETGRAHATFTDFHHATMHLAEWLLKAQSRPGIVAPLEPLSFSSKEGGRSSA
jgi:hypothetical protein